MEQISSQTSQYVITAKSRNGIIQQTRSMAASAVVLAMRFREAGYADVEVVDPMGNLLSPEHVRSDILNQVSARGATR